jgi:hypothetical protein
MFHSSRGRRRTGAAVAIHVEPHAYQWAVRHDGAAEPVSVHGDASAAIRAARDLARALGHVRVLLRDRYGRVHQVAPRGAPPDRS